MSRRRCTRYPFGGVKGGKVYPAGKPRELTTFEKSLIEKKRKVRFATIISAALKVNL